MPPILLLAIIRITTGHIASVVVLRVRANMLVQPSCGHVEVFLVVVTRQDRSSIPDFVMHRQAIQRVRVPDHGL